MKYHTTIPMTLLIFMVLLATIVVTTVLRDRIPDCLDEQARMQAIARNFGQQSDYAGGDLNGDGVVNVLDLSLQLSRMQQYNCR